MGQEKVYYGGQAVIEGVMMRGRDKLAIAVRSPQGEIVTAVHQIASLTDRHRWLKWPLIRGVVQLFEALVWGIRALSFSAQVAGEEHEQLTKRDIALTIGMAILLAVGLFIVVPTAATRLLHRLTDHPFWLNVGEGGLRLAIFVGYIGFISLFRDIRRVFQYHGAEHRVINAFEHKSQLLAAEVQRHSMRHLRCGTSFLLLVMVISVVVFAFLGWPDLWLRILSRVAMLPVIAGLSYELLRLCARYPECWPIRLIAAPGLWLQAMTTRPPDDHQVEVAIVALRAVLPDGGEVN